MNKIIMALKDLATLKHVGTYKNLKPIDVSKYNVTESGNVIKSRLEQEAEVWIKDHSCLGLTPSPEGKLVQANGKEDD